MENNKEKEEFKMPQIKSESDLNKVFDAIYDQGFGYISRRDDYHQNKIQKIVQKYNTLKLDIPDNFYRNLYDIKNYSEVEKEVMNHFSKFNPDDKINEFIKNIFSLKYDDRGKPPENNCESINTVIDWFKFKNKYNLIDKDFKFNKNYLNVDVYNLDKNSIKINFKDDYDNFESFYELIFNEKCIEIKHRTGDWQNIGKIEIKLFLNNTASIRGDLTKIKDYYYKDLMKNFYFNNAYIIYYKNKIEKINPKV